MDVTRIDATCRAIGCGHEAIVDVGGWPDEVPVPDVGFEDALLGLRCQAGRNATGLGRVQAGARRVKDAPYPPRHGARGREPPTPAPDPTGRTERVQRLVPRAAGLFSKGPAMVALSLSRGASFQIVSLAEHCHSRARHGQVSGASGFRAGRAAKSGEGNDRKHDVAKEAEARTH